MSIGDWLSEWMTSLAHEIKARLRVGGSGAPRCGGILARMPRWSWWHQATGPDDFQIRELLRAVWDLHAMYGETPWVWRGQAKEDFNLEPGIHTRMRLAGMDLTDANVEVATRTLLAATRDAQLDRHGEIRLPDVALLALIQHHGAATPLLDVSLDPIVALYMAVVSPNADDDDHDGVLFAIRKPSRVIAPFDARTFVEISPTLPANEVVFYTAPDVSDRLRIQRGHFLLGRTSAADARVTTPLRIEPENTALADAWVYRRMGARGNQGAPPAATSDIASFRVTSRFKPKLREWLEARTGMTKDFVYPTVWHQPHLDRFAMSQGRAAPLVPH
jgi:hypothetical protein